MITEKLIPRLRERFPNQSMKFGVPPAALVVISAAHPEVGDVQIFDEGTELTLVAGNFTHGHFSDFNSKSADEAERNIVDHVVQFLERLFADEIVMWGSQRGSGGWYLRGQSKVDQTLKPSGPLYVWSGPLAGG
jgi:hypothetical protein